MAIEISKFTENKYLLQTDGANHYLTKDEMVALVQKAAEIMGDMTLNDYQSRAKSTCVGNSYSHAYLSGGMAEEFGEFSGKIAKLVRKGVLPICFNREDALGLDKDIRHGIMLELSDCAWMLAMLCDWWGYTLGEVRQANIEKLADRQRRNTLIGEGDYR